MTRNSSSEVEFSDVKFSMDVSASLRYLRLTPTSKNEHPGLTTKIETCREVKDFHTFLIEGIHTDTLPIGNHSQCIFILISIL